MPFAPVEVVGYLGLFRNFMDGGLKASSTGRGNVLGAVVAGKEVIGGEEHG